MGLFLILQNEPPRQSHAEPVDLNKQTVHQAETKPAVSPQPQPVVQVAVAPVAPTPEPVPEPPKPTIATPAEAQQIAQSMAAQRGWTGYQWTALVNLWQGESGWRMTAYNRSSGACGIPQSLPCGKIPDWQDVNSQLAWGLDYVAGYGSPSQALSFWNCIGNCYSSRTKTIVYKTATWY